jgi:hypothetical protein
MLSALMPNGGCNLCVLLVRIVVWKQLKRYKGRPEEKKEAERVANALSQAQCEDAAGRD